MDVYESKRQLDSLKLLKEIIKRKRDATLKQSKKLLPSKKTLHKKTGKWCIKRDQKINKTLFDFNIVTLLHRQAKDEYNQMKDQFIEDVIELAGIPEQNFDCITIKTSRHHNKIRLYCEIFDDGTVGYVCDCYAIDLDTGYVDIIRQGKYYEDTERISSYCIIMPKRPKDKGTEGPA